MDKPSESHFLNWMDMECSDQKVPLSKVVWSAHTKNEDDLKHEENLKKG